MASSVGLILGGEFTGALLDLHHGRFGLAVRKAKAIARVLHAECTQTMDDAALVPGVGNAVG